MISVKHVIETRIRALIMKYGHAASELRMLLGHPENDSIPISNFIAQNFGTEFMLTINAQLAEHGITTQFLVDDSTNYVYLIHDTYVYGVDFTSSIEEDPRWLCETIMTVDDFRTRAANSNGSMGRFLWKVKGIVDEHRLYGTITDTIRKDMEILRGFSAPIKAYLYNDKIPKCSFTDIIQTEFISEYLLHLHAKLAKKGIQTDILGRDSGCRLLYGNMCYTIKNLEGTLVVPDCSDNTGYAGNLERLRLLNVLLKNYTEYESLALQAEAQFEFKEAKHPFFNHYLLNYLNNHLHGDKPQAQVGFVDTQLFPSENPAVGAHARYMKNIVRSDEIGDLHRNLSKFIEIQTKHILQNTVHDDVRIHVDGNDVLFQYHPHEVTARLTSAHIEWEIYLTSSLGELIGRMDNATVRNDNYVRLCELRQIEFIPDYWETITGYTDRMTAAITIKIDVEKFVSVTSVSK